MLLLLVVVASILRVTLAGIVLFFCLEKLIIWRHCHVERCVIHSAAGPLLVAGIGTIAAFALHHG